MTSGGHGKTGDGHPGEAYFSTPNYGSSPSELAAERLPESKRRRVKLRTGA